MRSVFGWSAAVALGFLFMCSTASAQVIGNFRWQLAPNCNVLSLTVESLGPSTFRLSGFDDLCGAAHRAPATGLAQLNTDGTVSFAVTTTRPDGLTISTSAVISLATIGGPWSDEYANTGTLSFNPPSPAVGEPRHITLTGPVSVQFDATAPNDNDSASFHFRAVAPILSVVTMPTGVTDSHCPGTYASPKAEPGFL